MTFTLTQVSGARAVSSLWISNSQLQLYILKVLDGVKMLKTKEQLLEELELMQFCIDDGVCLSDSNGLYSVLYYLTEITKYDQEIKISLWKDFRNVDN